jgi:GT2 family glycosyltransferase
MKLLAIVILNWNGKSFLRKFLPALLASCPDYAEVVIGDNASSDGSVDMLKTEFPSVKIIVNQENYGFAKGYNEILKQIDTKYYCLLNSDVEVTDTWIEPIITVMEKDKNVAAVQPKILSYYKKTHFEYAGAAGGFLDQWGYPLCRGRVFDVVEEDKNQYDAEINIFWATGAALFVRSDVYHRLGGLDEDFFAHQEEIDFCWRLKNEGYRILCVPQSTVYHVGGGTLSKNSAHKTFLNFRNNWYLLLKNLPKNKLIITFFVRFFLDITAAFFFLFKGNFNDFQAVFQAFFVFLKNRKKIKQKRGKNFTIAYQSTLKASIVFQYYFKKKQYFDGYQLK